MNLVSSQSDEFEFFLQHPVQWITPVQWIHLLQFNTRKGRDIVWGHFVRRLNSDEVYTYCIDIPL